MSAIAGLWRFDGRPDAAGSVGRMLTAQRVYGAHDVRDWSDGDVALGRCLHRTLPEDRFDRQPLQTGDGRLTLVADVRLDNREELSSALGLSPARVGERCDAALLLDCLDRWGERAVDRLVGDFAFACWDTVDRTLILARDFRGNRPLYFHCGDAMIAVASMAKGLHALAEVPYAPDIDAAAEFMLPTIGVQTRSFWQGIERVLPGTVLSVTRAGIGVRRYWQPQRPDRSTLPRDYVEGVRHHLDQAVAARLRGANGQVGAHLSSGFDSAAVTATAARLYANDGRVTAFTAVPDPAHVPPDDPWRIVDEGPLAAATAARYPNVDHVLIRSGDRSPLMTLDRDFALFEIPLLNRCNAPWVTGIHDEARRRGIDVVLSGEVGNMTLSYVGEEYLPELLMSGRLIELARVSAALLQRGSLRWRGLARRLVVPFLPATLRQAIQHRLDPLVGDPLAYAALSAAALEKLAERHGAHAIVPNLHRRDGFAMRVAILGRSDPGNYYKGALGGWGIDQRDPTSDRRLVDYMLGVPMAEYVAGGRFRSLPRRALADRLPPEVLNERRKGLQAADWPIALTAARSEVRDEIDRLRACAPAGEAIDLDRLDRLERDWPAAGWKDAKVVADYRIVMLRALSVGHFLRRASGSNG